jgi:hypothetical protein
MADQKGPSISRQPLGSDNQVNNAADKLLGSVGGGCRDRTDDPLLAKQVLSQLS